MYRYQHKLFEQEGIYIAGPECFYTYGYDLLGAMRARAEALGFQVTLPNDHPLDLENPDKQKRADSILADLESAMKDTTVIVADLEAFRGTEPDSGTIFEIGMAYAKGARCYGYTRDKRSFAEKNPLARLKEGRIIDADGKEMPYANLPFAPTIIGSTKIAEGDFDDCLKMLMTDLEEAAKQKVHLSAQPPQTIMKQEKSRTRPRIYLADFVRYDANGKEQFARMKEICREYGYEAVSPLDGNVDIKNLQVENPYLWAAALLEQWQQQVRECDVMIANLNNYRGYEVGNDVGFECGMGLQLGKKLYGFMDSAGKMIDKIPNLGDEWEYRDQTGSNVEDFDYPVNLMFASSMKIYEGTFAETIESIIQDLESGS